MRISATGKYPLLLCILVARGVPLAAQAQDTQRVIDQLLNRLAADEARIRELEQKLTGTGASTAAPPVAVVAEAAPPPPEEHDHMSAPGGGPKLTLRGFADFNLGFGQDANPLIFPLGPRSHTTFQTGEFDLFISSRLSDKLSFVSEVIIGSDPSNEWGLDMERLQLTFKPSPYFEISGGRYHTSIGYYNTAYHHGTWFQTATGRPFMYFFEDSGGLLPVHGVGATATGEVPGTEKLGLHWIAEISNGKPSSLDATPVQNFFSDKTSKAFNLAGYIRPEVVPGLQIGGSYYHDSLKPPGFSRVSQKIASLYAIFIGPNWEILNEAVLLSNRVEETGKSFRSPLMYTQVSRKFGHYRPYFRYQYVNVPESDPVNLFAGRYQGPSTGLRMDFSAYVALKLQYNRLYQRKLEPENGLDAQVAFTF